MDAFTIDLSPLDGKDGHHMITLVEADELNNDKSLSDQNSPPLVHVLEAPAFVTTSVASFHTPQCLICNAKLGVSGRGSMDVFSKMIKTASRHVDLDVAIESILDRKLKEEEVHSNIMCKKCFKNVEDIDSLESQLANLKQEFNNRYTRTLALLKHESGESIYIEDDNYDTMDINSISKNDSDFKIYSSSRVRPKRRRKVKSRPSLVKLEVKEEIDEHSLESFEFTNPSEIIQHSIMDIQNGTLEGNEDEVPIESQDIYSSNGENMQIDLDDVVDVDGLDVNTEETTIQIGDVLLPTLGSEIKFENKLSGERQDKYRCRYCQLQDNTFQDVEKHILENHCDRLTECEVCQLKLASRTLLLEHLEQHIASGTKPYDCHLCVQRFALPRQLRLHLRHHLGNTIPCYRCPKRFRSQIALQEHMNIHTGNRPYACERCNKKFTSKHMLKTHAKTHGARARPHKCKTCHKHFLTAHHLLDHELIHLNRKDFVCETCGKAFSTQRSLDLHTITHSGIKNYNCSICQKAFARKGEVEDHERTHTGEKPFQCEFCGATFSQRSNLLSHKKATHFDEKRYTCTECPKAFKRRRLLVYHMMSVHTGERPFKCEFCTAAFVYPEHYKKHLRIHTGEKPFKCEICGKAFNSRDNKNAHKFIHSDKKQYECTICGAGFMRKPLLCAHIVQHNGVTVEEVENYIKVNSADVVDAELLEHDALPSSSISMKIDDDVDLVRQVSLESDVEMMDRNIHLMETDDMPKYIIHTTGDRTDESVGHFLASLQGQVVEVRTEDLASYSDLTSDQITKMAQVAAQVVATQSNSSTSETFHIQVEEDKEKPTASSSERTIIQFNQRDLISRGQSEFSYKKEQISESPKQRSSRIWQQSTTANSEDNLLTIHTI